MQNHNLKRRLFLVVIFNPPVDGKCQHRVISGIVATTGTRGSSGFTTLLKQLLLKTTAVGLFPLPLRDELGELIRLDDFLSTLDRDQTCYFDTLLFLSTSRLIPRTADPLGKSV